MTEPTAHEALVALLTSVLNRPYCRTFGCTDCDEPHLHAELEAHRISYGPAASEAALLEAARSIKHRGEDDPTPGLPNGLVRAITHAPDLMPRSVLAYFHLVEIHIRKHRRKRERDIPPLAVLLQRILPCWPAVTIRIARGELEEREIPQALADHLQQQAKPVTSK
jgi:hypothetical protein